jgi:hypothetical protein
MIFIVDWVENKGADWKVATLREGVEGGRTYENVSINRTKKDGTPFPKFDEIAPGATINGDIWQNPTSQKWALFPERPKTPPKSGAGPAYRGKQIEDAQIRKAGMVHEAQENKNLAVKTAAAMRDATMLAIAALDGSHFETIEEREDELKRAFERFRDWYLAMWLKTEQKADLPV